MYKNNLNIYKIIRTNYIIKKYKYQLFCYYYINKYFIYPIKFLYYIF